MDILKISSRLNQNVFGEKTDDDFSDRLNYRYTVALLVAALGVASLYVPAYRGVWRDARLYLCAAAGLALVACATGLRSLELSGTPRHGDPQATALAARASALTRLDLGWCAGLSGAGAAALARGCSGLTSLSLAYCEQAGVQRGVGGL